MKIQFNILSWLAKWFFPAISQAPSALEELSTKVDRWTRTKGELWVISHLKEIRLLYTRYSCGIPVHSSDHIIGIRRDGLPKGFPILNDIVMQHGLKGLSFTLTLLSISRTIKAWKNPDLSTIENPFKGDLSLTRSLGLLVPKVLYDLGINPRSYSHDLLNDHYYSIKAGPEGLATWVSPLEAWWMPLKLHSSLGVFSQGIHNLINLWKGVNVGKFHHLFVPNFKDSVGLMRKLSIVRDPDGKSRIIAIFDYWSQTVLKRIHKDLFSLLRTIPQDRTFTQDPIVDFKGPYYSYDLSAATDRFPITFQKEVISYLYGAHIADAWADVLVGHEFWVPWENRSIKYTVGQPMGAYSSWATFTLSHHIIVQISAIQVGKYPTKDYILLGDDIVIGGADLAEAYRSNMSMLGVDISSHKSHVSSNTYEFAKRWFKDGQECSGIQVGAFLETRRNYTLLYQTLRQYLERGFIPSNFARLPTLVEAFLLHLGMYPALARNILRKVEVLHAFSRWIQYGDGGELRNVMHRYIPSEASIPSPDHPMFKPYVGMRLDTLLGGMHNVLLKEIDNMAKRLRARLTTISQEASPWPQGLGGVSPWDPVPEFHGDCLGVINPEIIGPGMISNTPVLMAIATLERDLHNDHRLFMPEQDYKAAIAALCIPDLERISRNRESLAHQMLFAKVAQRFMETVNRFTYDQEAFYIEETYFNDIDPHLGRVTSVLSTKAEQDPNYQLGPDFDWNNIF